ncbi:hypothetical protein [Sphingomonas bacterium]|uniref:hypothetical protein n=1 Tax=Sphingomonas bacterium TaxID=1895847 RepID=UPI001574F167|nr:hypothetical protein [Sphingomonas bacterium]
MNPFEFVLAILAIVFGARIIRDYLRHRGETPIAPPSDDTRLLVEEVARLRDRVQVLERVVTDNHGSIDLDRRIEQLRDR